MKHMYFKSNYLPIMALLCWIGLSYNTNAQQLRAPQNCSVNAGADFTICFNDSVFTLEGFISGVDPASISWEALDPQFTLEDPTSLTTNVVPSNGGGTYTTGTFAFTLTGSCIGSVNDSITDVVMVTIEGLVNPPDIFEGGVSVESVDACTEALLTGTAPGVGEYGYWYTIPFDNQVSITVTDNGATVHLEMNPSYQCSSYQLVYGITNDGCFAEDTIDISFERGEEDVRIYSFVDGFGYCIDTTLFISGTPVGCNGDAEVTFLTTPNGIQPTLLQEYTSGDLFDMSVSGTGWYTIEYNPNLALPCVNSTDTVRVFLCVTPLTTLNWQTTITECGPFTNYNVDLPHPDLGCTYSDWTITPTTAAADVTITDIGGGDINVAIGDPDLFYVRIRRSVQCDTCDYINGQGDTVDLNCIAYQTVYFRRGLEFETDADTLNYLCGGDPVFVPINNIPSSGNYSQCQVEVLATPDPVNVPLGSYNCGFPFDTREVGLYKFRITTEYVSEAGVACRDTACLTLIVDEFPNISGGVTDTFSTCDSAQLQGSVPENTSILVAWEQICGPGTISFSDPNIPNPIVTADVAGVYCLVYSYTSDDQNCEIADTINVVVLPCDEPCYEITAECKLGEEGYTYVVKITMDAASLCPAVDLAVNGTPITPLDITWNNGTLCIIGEYFVGFVNYQTLCIEARINCVDACIYEIEDCIDAPRDCCPNIFSYSELECDDEKEGAYSFILQMLDPNNSGQSLVIYNNCGADVSWQLMPSPVGYTYYYITISGNLQPGDTCCLRFRFQDRDYCDFEICLEIPECECYTNFEVEAEECVEPQSSFCVLVSFNYWGPPNNASSALWYLIPGTSSSGLTLTSATSLTDPGQGILYGYNEWKLCFDYTAEECNDEVVFDLRGVFYTNEGAVCCNVDELFTLPCCCPDKEIEIVYCGDQSDLDNIHEFFAKQDVEDQVVYVDPDGGIRRSVDDTPDGPNYQLPKGCADDDCCFICEDGYGPIWVECEGMFLDGSNHTFQWSTGSTDPIILGTPFQFYSVTVTDADGCEYVANIYVDCNGTGFTDPSDPRKTPNVGEIDLNKPEVTDFDLRVHPNPAQGWVILNGSMLESGGQVSLYTTNGQLAFTQAIGINTSEVRLELASLAGGMYYIEWTSADGTQREVRKLLLLE